MRRRCNSPKHHNFKYYGARGITYTPEWSSFDNFYRDMSPSYSENLSLDRIDVNGNYNKENCRWATHKEQTRNTRHNKLINGKTLGEWSELLGIKRSTLAQRLYVYHWSPERVITS